MKNITIILFGTLITASAHARKPIGPAGCGLGNVFFGKDNQVLAATTNGSSYSQTSGITSGTSNCVDSNGYAKLESYIEANQEALAKDMARGNGNTIAGLTQILGCERSSEANNVMKDNFEIIFQNNDSTASEISTKVRSVLRSHQSIGHGCNT